MAPYSVLGSSTEATIDQVNQWMRSTDWYQQQLRAWGQDPGHPTLASWQRDTIRRMAQANGVVVDEGNVELDDHGNFNPKGHKLRNTLIVVGIAAAAIAAPYAIGAIAGAGGGGAAAAGTGATVAGVEGGAAGLSSSALAGLGTGAMGATALPALGTAATVGGAAAAGAPVLEGLAAGGGGSTSIPVGTALSSAEAIKAAKDAGYTIDDYGVVQDAANVPPDGGGGGGLVGGRSYADLVKYGLPIGGQIVSSLIAANASGKATDAQQKYLEDALAYEKENDLYNRGIAADKVKLEAGRYADYTNRIGGFVANGQNSNDRMASLLGLPARTGGGAAYSGGGSSRGGSQGVQLTPELTQRVLDNYKALGLTPTGPGTGPTDSSYFADKYAETGGSTPDNDRYWFGPEGRIAKEAQQAGLKFGAPPTPPATSPTPSQTGPTPGPLPIQPKTKAPVAMRAPDGSTRLIPADQVDFYTQRGATMLSAGA